MNYVIFIFFLDTIYFIIISRGEFGWRQIRSLVFRSSQLIYRIKA